MEGKKRQLLNISRRFTSEIEEVLKDSPGTSASAQPRPKPSHLIKRGRELQVNQKKRKRLLLVEEEKQIQVSLCKMKIGRGGSFVRDGKSIELFAVPSCSYVELVELASRNLHIKLHNRGQHLTLITLSGAVIVPDSDWTLQAYLRKIHKSDARLGVGYIDSEDSSSDDESKIDSTTGKGSGRGTRGLSTLPSSELFPAHPLSLGDGTTSHQSDVSPSHPVTVPSGDDDSYVRPMFNVVSIKPGCKRDVSVNSRASRKPAPSIDAGSCMEFDPKELAEATNNYRKSSIIGKGGYGRVHKGRLRGCLDVAIKVLSVEGHQALIRSHPTAQMQSEVNALTRFRHPNILTLCGYCLKPPVLVYELMSNGSLYSHLHKEDRNLTWAQRVSILEGTCKGLVYLHSAVQPMVHQDIKSANILLDSAMNPKLADFGFAIELPKLSHGTTVFSAGFIARSDGYFPSEVTSGTFSDRSDVYSYGVVVLETFTGQLVYDDKRPDKKLTDHLEEELSSYELFKGVLDPKLNDSSNGESIYRLIKECMKTHSKRPSSAQVLNMWQL